MPFEPRTLALDPVDPVFDTVGGDVLERSTAIIRTGGTLVAVAQEPPAIPAEAKIETTCFVVEPNHVQLVELARLVDRGVPAIDSVFPLFEARAAFERSMTRGKRGEVVLRVADE